MTSPSPPPLLASAPAPAPSTFPTVRVGTRKSALACRQTEIIVSRLRQLHPHISFLIEGVSVAGDRDKTSALSTMGKGLWTTDLEDGLRAGRLDLVVHSLKDMPTNLPDGCALGCVTERHDPLDALVIRNTLRHLAQYSSIAALPHDSIIGTSSVRRIAQLRRRYPHLQFADIRGNIDTRLRKLDDDSGPHQPYTALVLAAAGLRRMGLDHRITQLLEPDLGGIMYAVGQGALGIEIRSDSPTIAALLEPLADRAATLACAAERSLMRLLEAGCSVPLGVVSSWLPTVLDGLSRLQLRAIVVSRDGSDAVEGDMVSEVRTSEQAEALGARLAKDLVDRGARHILHDIRHLET